MTAQQSPCRNKEAAATGTRIRMGTRTKRMRTMAIPIHMTESRITLIRMTENRGTFILITGKLNSLTRMPTGMFITAMYTLKKKCAL